MQKFKQNIILPLAVTMLLFACSHHAPAPVIDLSASGNSKNADKYANRDNRNRKLIRLEKQTHLVKPGDTLFSIAWRYSLDYKSLAKVNHLKAYRIYPGQQLKLTPENKNNERVFSSESLLAAINKEILNKPVKASKQTKTERTANHKVTSKKKPKSRSSRVANHRKLNKKNAHSSIKHWIWPVNGKIINHFSTRSNQNKGLDIAGKIGTPVRATAKGKVVYSGSGLRGYGRLVIIKHNDNYLSAYAHNKKIHVEENEFVKAGQRIADLGSSGSDREKLHFEIRYKGKPVDPLNYLPKSGLL